MSDSTLNSSRRTFLGNALKAGAGSLLLAASPAVNAADKAPDRPEVV